MITPTPRAAVSLDAFLSEEDASQILQEAARADAQMAGAGDLVRLSQLRDAALHAGIAPAAIDHAIAAWQARQQPGGVVESGDVAVQSLLRQHRRNPVAALWRVGDALVAPTEDRVVATDSGHDAPLSAPDLLATVTRTLKQNHAHLKGEVATAEGVWQVWQMGRQHMGYANPVIEEAVNEWVAEIWLQVRANEGRYKNGSRLVLQTHRRFSNAVGAFLGLGIVIGVISSAILGFTMSPWIMPPIFAGVVRVAIELGVRHQRRLTADLADRLANLRPVPAAPTRPTKRPTTAA